MHREGQPGDPGLAVALVLQVELGRGRVLDAGFRAQVVDGLDQQMRLLAAHQVRRSASAAVRPPARARTRPGRRCRCRAGRWRMMLATSSTRGKTRRTCGGAPAVARLVEVETHAVAVQVDDVGGAACRRCRPGGRASGRTGRDGRTTGGGMPGIHRHPGTETAVAQVRPVADRAVADAHQVGEAVAATYRRDRWTGCRRRRPVAGLSPHPETGRPGGPDRNLPRPARRARRRHRPR